MTSKTETTTDEAREIVAANIDEELRGTDYNLNSLAASLDTNSVDLYNSLTDVVVVFAVAARLGVKFEHLVRGIR